MQPYFLPYLGYFQLMKAVDTFVYYDDVTYIKQGWINRNNIQLNRNNYRFTLELRGVSSFKKINEIEVGANRQKLYKTFVQAYSNHPYFEQAHWVIYEIFHSQCDNLFNYILQTHQILFGYLGIDINFIISSKIEKDCSLHGKDKVIDICKRLKATSYVNAIGGQSLYDKEEFKQQGIDLFFLKSDENLPNLSIIDVIMNHSPGDIRTMLTKYTLI